MTEKYLGFFTNVHQKGTGQFHPIPETRPRLITDWEGPTGEALHRQIAQSKRLQIVQSHLERERSGQPVPEVQHNYSSDNSITIVDLTKLSK